MAEQTGIAWTDATFNPWIGCTAVSPACDRCYAKALVERWGGDFATRRRTAPANWRKPLAWNRAAAAAGVRRRVFCASLADVFDNQVPEEWRADLWALIRATPALDWQLLTKRPQNIAKMLPDDWRGGYPNVWLGTTVESPAEAARRIPHLLAVAAALHFLSCEPLLEITDLERVRLPVQMTLNALTGYYTPDEPCGLREYATRLAKVPTPIGAKIGWVIIGGESGPGARPMHRQWADTLIYQCRHFGVPVFMKQIGSNRPTWPDGITGKGDTPEQWPDALRVQQFPQEHP